MKNTILAVLLGLSATAAALPGTTTAPIAEDTVTIRVNEQTGVAEMQDGDQWITLQAVELAQDARVEKTQYYGAYTTCGAYVECAPVVPPCATACDSGVYVVPGYSYGYVEPVRPYVQPYVRPYVQPYVQPYVAPARPRAYVYPRGYYRRGPSVYYNYPRARVYRRRY